MIDIDGLATSIINELKTYTGSLVIFADQGGKRPDGSFITLKILSIQGNKSDYDIEEKNVVPSENPSFEKDIEYSYISFPQATISFTIYGDDRYVLAQKAHQWFRLRKLSKELLDGFSAVVRDITNISNRDVIFAGTTYERKQGFDITLEIKDEIRIIEDTIEIISIKEGEING